MLKSFDLFKIDRNGQPLWLGAMETFEEAQERARQECLRHPDPGCQFRVMDSKTGMTKLLAASENKNPL